MNQNAFEREHCLKETINSHKQKTPSGLHTAVSAATSCRSDSVGESSEHQEYYRNVTTTIVQQQPPNKFGLNIKKVSGKILPSSEQFKYNTNVKTQIARISYGKENHNHNSSRSTASKEIETGKVPIKKANIMDPSNSAQLVKNFAKKKQEREQEIKEIQEMLNEIKSPQKSSTRTLEDSAKESKAETVAVENSDKDGLKEANTTNIAKSSISSKMEKTKEGKRFKTSKENYQTDSSKIFNNAKKPLQHRSNTDTQLTTKSSEALSAATSRVSRKDATTRSSATALVNKPRSKSAQLPLSANSAKNSNKKLSYNPEEARRYMEMQKKQRKSQHLSEPVNKIKIEKEEIKKRLEELKKNTRKLVSKNLQKKEMVLAKTPLSEPPKPRDEEKSKDKKDLANELKNMDLAIKKPLTNNSKTERARSSSKITENTRRSVQSLKSFAEAKTFPLIENHRRIGLLRKTENDKDFSFNSHKKYNFDKENQNLVTLTKHLTQSKGNLLTEENLTNKDKQTEKTENGAKEIEIQTDLRPVIKDNSKTSDPEMPESNLKSSKSDDIPLDSLINKEIPKKESSKQTPDMPYWLRPSAAQIYPYNFITAVRRKLEAIAQPLEAKNIEKINTPEESSSTDLTQQQKKRKSAEMPEEKCTKKFKSRAEETGLKDSNENNPINKEINSLKHLKPTPVTSTHCDTEKTIAKKKENQSLFLKEDDIVQPPSVNSHIQNSLNPLGADEPKQTNTLQIEMPTSILKREKPVPLKLPSKSINHCDTKPDCTYLYKQSSNYKSVESLNSEITSNLSSISLQNPLSNTLTEVSSLKTESRRTFVYANKNHSENTDDEVCSLTSGTLSLPPPERREKQNEHFEFVKPRPVSPLSLEKVEKLKIKRKVTDSGDEKSDKEMDFSQILEDFNRSLSQVIRVNEQLKSTLDKSQQILSPHSTKKSSDTEKQYSSDFEKSTSKMDLSSDTEKLKESLQKRNEILKLKKRELFEMAEKVKPLLKPQKQTQSMEAEIMTDDDKPLPVLNLNIDLKSLSNSCQTSAEHKTQKTTAAEEDDMQKETTSSVATQAYEELPNEIEKLKVTLRQTILESKEKRKEREERRRIIKEKQNLYKQSVSESDSHHLKQPLFNSIEKQDNCASILKEVIRENYDGQKTNTISSNIGTKHSYKEYKSFEKYQKQYKNLANENNERLHTKFMEIQDSKQQKSNNSSEISYRNSQKGHTKTASQNSRNDSFHEKNNSSSRLSQEHTKTLVTQNSSSNNTQNLKTNELEMHASARSEAKNSERFIKTLHSTDDPITSSIAEALQNTYESTQNENESVITLNEKAKFKTNKSERSSHNEVSSNFIKSHINCSRGDYQEITSKQAQLNETQFQEAIKAASQISSEFAQSADDEITSSVASKHLNKQGSNLFSLNVLSNNKLQQNPITTTSPSKLNRRSSLGNEILKFFTQCDPARSHRHEPINDSMSESSLNYSNVGLYNKLIQNENNKSQHLMTLLKMREKALLDRTKGQIAWLQIQKARYKAKGLINHIAAIKKKQRGILMKMEKEREEIKRLLQTTTATTNNNETAVVVVNTNIEHNSPTKYKRSRFPPSTSLAKSRFVGQPQQTSITEHISTVPILKATYKLESSNTLEELLKKREEDLRKRREHVERLMQWHQRLDEEEAEVLSLERQLLSYNNVPHMVEEQKQHSNLAKSKIFTEKLTTSQIAQIQQSQSQIICEQPTTNRTPEKKRASRARKMEKRLKEIDKSLRELSHIPASSGASSGCIGQTNNDNDDTVSSNNSEEVDFVRTTGMKLNKLWKRLTSQQREKFEPNRRYKLCKTDLERLYEEAKMAVLKDFAENEERIAQELLEKTAASNISSSNSPTAAIQNGVDINDMGIPVLNLDFSSGHSEAEEESTNNSNTNNNKQGNYSPSVAEQNFKAQELLNSSISSETSSEQRAIDSRVQEENKRLENNLQMFSVLSQRLQTTNSHIQRGGTGVEGVQRSLSDTEISNTPKFITDKTTPSQTTSNVTIASQTNSITATEQHQRSKSSIVEMTNIPSVETQISDYKLNNPREEKQNEIFTESEHVVNEPSATSTTIMPTRTSVIRSIGLVTPIHSQQTSAEVTTISEDTKQKTSFSGQFSTNTNTIAKEISNKLEEISAAVTQLSHINALPSYESVTQSHQTKTKSTEESAQININDASNLSTDVSSYSFNFDNITTDKHSSPGTSTNPTNSIQNKTITSITYTQENDSELMSTNKETSSTSADANTSANTTKSKTFLKDDPATKSQPTLTQSDVENRLLDIYEADFESDLSNATHIEDITIPTFETTADTTLEDEDTDVLTKSTTNEDNTTTKDSSNQTLNNDNEILNNEKSTANIQTYVKPSPDKKLLPPPPPPLPPPPPPPPSINSSVPTVSFTTVNNQTASNHLMPDIINELELRRHQLIVDNEHLKQYEHVTAVPYMYVREIPNKPPPPYVPPAHGSPMTTIFPSEDRIKDITFRRTHELYCEFLKTDYCNETGDKLPSVMEEQITNIYERIILDICREYLEEHEEILRDGDPTNFHSQLAFFNPPNRLRCIQDAIYKEVRSCLAMDKTQPKRTQVYSVYGQRAKQDHIGKIIIQEMYDEDDRWCNFHREESEVLHLMVEEMIIKNITSIAKEVLLEEGGTVDEENIDENITEENAANKQNEKCLNDDNVQQQETESQISVLMETFNEKQDDQTYCIDETQQNCTVFNKTPTENHQPENVDLENSSTNNTNVLKTCT